MVDLFYIIFDSTTPFVVPDRFFPEGFADLGKEEKAKESGKALDAFVREIVGHGTLDRYERFDLFIGLELDGIVAKHHEIKTHGSDYVSISPRENDLAQSLVENGEDLFYFVWERLGPKTFRFTGVYLRSALQKHNLITQSQYLCYPPPQVNELPRKGLKFSVSAAAKIRKSALEA